MYMKANMLVLPGAFAIKVIFIGSEVEVRVSYMGYCVVMLVHQQHVPGSGWAVLRPSSRPT